MSPSTRSTYRRARDTFDAVVAAVPADRWDAPSASTDWTVRDVTGHVIWGQEQLAHWATRQTRWLAYLGRESRVRSAT